jgi:3',5'-cyclic AMP phosphodiesterase CpdA
MQTDDEFDRSVVLSSLWRDIENLRTRGLEADFIVFTGDVAYRGLIHEYKLAENLFFDPLLKASHLPKSRLFMVPGNHDIDRTKTQMLQNPLSSVSTKDDIYRLVENPEKRELLLSPLAAYRSFLRSYGGTSTQATSSLFGYRSLLTLGNLPVTIVGLNSAWLSGFNLDRQGNVDDSRHLAVSELQLRECTLGEAQLMLVLMHHPPDWLMESDQLLVEHLLANRRAILLRGHVHRPDLLTVTHLSGKYASIPAGSVFDGRQAPNAYNFIQLDLDAGQGTIYFRRYNDRRQEWQKDTESTGDGLDGQDSFTLPTAKAKGPVLIYPGRQQRGIKVSDCRFTDRCLINLRALGLSESKVFSLVQTEFKNHSLYNDIDLHDYPLQLGSDYILFLEKIGKQIEFRHIVSCTKNHSQLVAWSSIVACYSSLTTMSYRRDPTSLAFSRGQVTRACERHRELASMMRDYYTSFKPTARKATRGERGKESKREDGQASIHFHLDVSLSSCSDVKRILKLVESNDIELMEAVGLIVASLEQSLQHLHKLIILYPPGIE